ncbi:heme A synthase [Falsirhodobacter sp. 20TX0035]|uniref:heme A synthase n=1 Tax=Falsirhodobacter sp. 20TX0035 TaxID=3022019 RepID=UPI002330F705|nr:heme A synthase [Falsirhodobacter sp. 20TX0035]MDB6455049.1 COX15/CtaA family protein [Falsirhodobacter sp. 20TX0035]
MAKRSIFEEVGEGATPAAPQAGGLIDRGTGGARRAIRIWLMVLFALVAVMIVIGGLTRLSDAGLSITEWKPVTGAIPPMNAADWQSEFDLYQQSPQYRLTNEGMTMGQFQQIYWWEWGHRFLGRVIGLVWALGFLGFWIAGKIPAGWTKRLLWVGVLGGLQGAVGWWMVASGLEGDMTSVASYRLATHLGIGFVILGFLTWYALLLGRTEGQLLQARRVREAKQFGMSTGLLHLVFLQILLGALVAGIDAGRSFPTWPLMNGSFFPADAFYVPDGGAAWRAFFENPGLVQFVHRMVAYLVFVFGIVVWLRGRKSVHKATRTAFHMVFGMIWVQVALGIVTVLTAASLHPAITHQIGAIVLWVLILRARYLSQYPKVTSLRGGTA